MTTIIHIPHIRNELYIYVSIHILCPIEVHNGYVGYVGYVTMGFQWFTAFYMDVRGYVGYVAGQNAHPRSIRRIGFIGEAKIAVDH